MLSSFTVSEFNELSYPKNNSVFFILNIFACQLNKSGLETYLTITIAFLSGFTIAWVLRTVTLNKEKRQHISSKGLLESERLIKETLRKESAMAFQQKETLEAELNRKLKEAEKKISSMDEDILLLQKSNEETEELLRKGLPELHKLKLKLIEANNTISRLKGL